MINIFRGKKILVAGGTGLVGQQLVPKLINFGAKVFVASLDDKSLVNHKIENFYNLNLMNLDNCIKITKDKEIVFNLLGVTGSPKINIEKPASFMMSNIYCAINLLMAAQISKVKKYLYTSTYGVYAHSTIMKEDDVWKTFPSENDKFAGWAKRIGELQIEAFKIEYNFESLHIVRPANIYGPYDKFDLEHSHVFGASITKVPHCTNGEVTIWGDGSEERDLLYVSDLVDFIKLAIKKQKTPFGLFNVGFGSSIKISDLVKKIINLSGNNILVKNDPSKPTIKTQLALDYGKAKRLLGWEPKVSLDEGILKTMDWHRSNIPIP